MAEPWFDPIFAVLYLSIAGGLGGAAVGLVADYGIGLVRKGQRRSWVGGVLAAFLAIGIASMGVAVVTQVTGQPTGIWVSLAGVGVLLSLVPFFVSRKLKRLYEQAIK